MIDFFIKANLGIAVIMFTYALVFKGKTQFTTHRFFILLGTLVALLSPLIFPLIQSSGASVTQAFAIQLPAFEVNNLTPKNLPQLHWLWLIYWGGLGFFSLHFIAGLFWIILTLMKAKKQRINQQNIYRVQQPNLHFTFFGYVVVSENTQADLFELVLKHEQVHKNQWHTVDLIFAELLKIVFWFNPMVWILKRWINQNLEYIADNQSAGESQAQYSQWLLHMANIDFKPSSVNLFFNKSLLKYRLAMLNQPHRISSVGAKILGFSFAFFTILILACTSPNTSNESVIPTDTQQEVLEENEDIEAFKVVDEMPSFKGGNEALFTYLGNNISYPKEAESQNIEGIVYVSFIITSEGKVTRAKVEKGIGSGCDEEALRVIENMPDWNPGKHNGKFVNVQYNIPIKFSLKP